MSRWRHFSAELKRRRVYPVVAAYAVFAFVILQVAEITFEPLGIPNWAMIALIVLSGVTARLTREDFSRKHVPLR